METLLLAAAVLLPLHASPLPPTTTVGVPFGCGHAYVVSQAHDTGSHLQNDTWAWDFRMPPGTPIVAAMDGEVRLARGDSSLGGCDPAMARHANYVVLAHANGIETQYLHFAEVTVKAGQRVKAGELIGYSGETGWACGPHLHFKVTTTGPGWNNPSVPSFIDGHGDPQRDVLVRAPSCSTGDVMMATRSEANGGQDGLSAPATATAAATLPAASVEVRRAAAAVLESPADAAPGQAMGATVPASGSASGGTKPAPAQERGGSSSRGRGVQKL